jgi:carbamoyltransferase
MTVTLGISGFYHDSAAALVRNGEIIAAAQEERFSRIKGDPGFPLSAIAYCLEEAKLSCASKIDTVVFYDKPIQTFDRLMESYASVAPRGLKSWLNAMPYWIKEKLHIPSIVKELLHGYEGSLLYTPHHMAHAAAAFFPSPFEESAILTIDGVGEWATAALGIGRNENINLISEMRFPDSLGLLYSAFTHFCGFKVNSGEYKLMGLAPYGKPCYLDDIKRYIAEIGDDGTLRLDLSYFGYLDSLEMISEKFSNLFGGPPRLPELCITTREMNLAASIQAFTDEVVLKMAKYVFNKTHMENLCLAGGVALNCVSNGRLLKEGPFKKIWIQPAAGDAGSSLGAALAVQFGYHGIKRPTCPGLDRQKGSYLGPSFSEREISAYLDANLCPYIYLERDNQADTIAQALSNGKIVGFFSGRMEFGPRSLGGRSILGDPRKEDTQRTMNLRIKYRESFRPFAPAVLSEDVSEYFELDCQSPYMLLVVPVKQDRCKPRACDTIEDEDLLNAANQVRSDIPAVTHWDYSARVQTVHKETNPLFHEILTCFKKRTGYGVLVNTSFNVRGEPIVCSPEDAYRCFMRTELDYLFLEGFWLEKSCQPICEYDDDWKKDFTLD